MNGRRRLLGIVLVLALPAVAVVACSLAVDLDPLSNGCGSDGTCRPGVPPGWEGPAVLAGGAIDAGCIAPFANTTLGTLLVDPDAGPASCRCDCALAPGSCVWSATAFQGPGCTGGSLSNVPFASGCVAPAATGSGVFSVRFEAGAATSDAGCIGTAVPTRPPLAPEAMHLCTGTFLHSSCSSDELCLPRGAIPCVARTGDQACPSSYPAKRLLSRRLDDGRGCSACSCAFDASACAPLPSVIVSSSPCGAVDGGLLLVPTSGCTSASITVGPDSSFTIIPSANACSVKTAPAPTGAVVPADLVTVCCTQ